MTYVRRSDGAVCAYSMTLNEVQAMLATQDLACEAITQTEYEASQYDQAG